MRISFLASSRPDAQTMLGDLVNKYGQSEPADADYIVALGGDGTALNALHAAIQSAGKPVFSMRIGRSVGFLSNLFSADDLEHRLHQAVRYSFHPLRVRVEDIFGGSRTMLTINDASLLRQTRQTARLAVSIDGTRCGDIFVGDGILVATPIGSTAYNQSAGGPLLPLQSSLLALTGIAPYGEWSHVAMDDHSAIDIEVQAPSWRPVRLETDVAEFRDVARAGIRLARDTICTLLFDANPILQSRPLPGAGQRRARIGAPT